jgi:predicted hydrocarbon binding protein
MGMKGELKMSHKSNLTVSSDGSLLEQLKEESLEKDLSLNSLVNQILRLHVDWYSNASRAGFLPIRRIAIQKFLERYTEDELYQIGLDVAKETNKDLVLLMRDKFDLDNALHVIESWMKASNYPYRHSVTDRTHKIVIHHDMGTKWANYLAGVFTGVLELFNVTDVQFDHTQCTLICIINM